MTRAASVVFMALLFSSLYVSNAHALPPWLDTFTTRYPAATRLDTCGTCHNNFTSNSPRNDYGDAFDQAGGASDPAAALAAIENADSDNDGTLNLAEIQTGTGFFPGWACDDYTQAVNPPADLADFVDPNDVGCLGGPTSTTTSTTPPTSTTVPTTSTTVPATSTTVSTTSTTAPTTSTTLPEERCSQPLTSGASPTASDCLFILRTAVGSQVCSPACICAPKGTLPTTATDALICLKKAVGQSVTLNCPCGGVTTTSVPPTTTSTITTTTSTITATTSTTSTTTGGGSIENGLADYDSRCSFCHAAGAHDPNSELASDLRGDGAELVPDLGTIDSAMDGILLSDQQLADMAAFLDSLDQ